MCLLRILLLIWEVTCLFLSISSMAGTSLASEECQVWTLRIAKHVREGDVSCPVGTKSNLWELICFDVWNVLKDKLHNLFHTAPKFEEELKKWILICLCLMLYIYMYMYIDATFLYDCIRLLNVPNVSCFWVGMACRFFLTHRSFQVSLYVFIYDMLIQLVQPGKNIICIRLTIFSGCLCFKKMDLQYYYADIL